MRRLSEELSSLRFLTEQEIKVLDFVEHLSIDGLAAQYREAVDAHKERTTPDLLGQMKRTYKIPGDVKVEQAFQDAAVIYECRRRGLVNTNPGQQPDTVKDSQSKIWLQQVTCMVLCCCQAMTS
jgi:hypothetical protein